MSKAINSTGRSKRDAKHVRLYEWLLASDAYRSLSIYSRALLVEVNRRYNGTNNGQLGMSVREAALALNCSDKPIRKAFAELQDKGFFIVRSKGGFNCKISHSTLWILTQHGYKDKLATKEFMRWKSAADSRKTHVKEKTRCTQGTRTVVREPEQSPKIGQNSPCGGTRVHTYSLPDPPAQTTGPAAEGLPNQRANPDKAGGTVIPLPIIKKNGFMPIGDLATLVLEPDDVHGRMSKLFGTNENRSAAQ